MKKNKINIQELSNLNPEGKEFTVEKFRELSDRPDMPEEEAKKIILDIKRYADIIIRFQTSKEWKKSK